MATSSGASCPYTTVFDASHKPPDWYEPVFGLCFVVIGIFLWIARDVPPVQGRWRRGRRPSRWFPHIWLGFSLVWTLAATVSALGGWLHTQETIKHGTPVVEGPVEQFHPMPASGHDEEHFTVDGVYFAYSDYVESSGFNTTGSHGGPIREGLEVRIHYIGPPTHATIVKLEIRSC